MVFGKRKKVKEEKMNNEEVQEVPDLVVDNPNVPDIEQKVETKPVEPKQEYVGMPGFVPENQPAPQPAPQPVPAQTAPVPVAQPSPVTVAQPAQNAPAPTPPKPTEQFQVVGAELVGEGVYRYILLTNKKIGEVGEVYDY
jgi:hypothetical protein